MRRKKHSSTGSLTIRSFVFTSLTLTAPSLILSARLRAQRGGVFTSTIYDPATSPRVPFPANTIPASRVDPIAAQVLQHYPLPNAAGANNYARTAVEPDSQDQFDGRADHVFNEKHRAFVRYSYLRDDDTPVTFLPDGSGNLTDRYLWGPGTNQILSDEQVVSLGSAGTVYWALPDNQGSVANVINLTLRLAIAPSYRWFRSAPDAALGVAE